MTGFHLEITVLGNSGKTQIVQPQQYWQRPQSFTSALPSRRVQRPEREAVLIGEDGTSGKDHDELGKRNCENWTGRFTVGKECLITTEPVEQDSCLGRLWNWFNDTRNGVEEGLCDILA